MQQLPNLGIAIRCFGSPELYLKPVKAAEKAGFRSVWLVEVNDVDTIALASALSQVTTKIEICTGVVNSSLRLPTLLAMGAATVSNISYGRFSLGVGAGSSPVKDPSSNTTGIRVTRLRETLQILRTILSGTGTSFQGSLYKIQDFQLGLTPKHPIPLLGAAMGLRMVKTVAEIADGVILMLPTIDHAKHAVRTIRSVMEKKHTNQFRIACHFVTAVSEKKSILNARRAVAQFCAIPPYRNSFSRMGFPNEVAKICWALNTNPREAWRSVPAEMADSLIVHGNVEQCVKKISEYLEIGITEPIIYPYFSEKGPEALKKCIKSFSKFLP